MANTKEYTKVLKPADRGGHKIVKYYATGSAALSETITLGNGILDKLVVKMHLSAASATSENFTVTLDSTTGAAYDAVLYTKDMDTVADVLVQITDVFAATGDKLVFAWANTDTRTFGMTVELYMIENL